MSTAVQHRLLAEYHNSAWRHEFVFRRSERYEQRFLFCFIDMSMCLVVGTAVVLC